MDARISQFSFAKQAAKKLESINGWPMFWIIWMFRGRKKRNSEQLVSDF